VQLNTPVEDCCAENEKKSNLAQENSGNEGENYESDTPANFFYQEEQFGLFRQPLWRFKQHIADKPQLCNHALHPICVLGHVKDAHRSMEPDPVFSTILVQRPDNTIYRQTIQQERSQPDRACEGENSVEGGGIHVRLLNSTTEDTEITEQGHEDALCASLHRTLNLAHANREAGNSLIS
jgi:hypothetical protein